MATTEAPAWMSWSRADVRQALEQCDVVVLHGGTSGEREVSLESGRAVIEALDPSRGCPPRSVQGVEISASGAWIVEGQELEPAAALRVLPQGAVYLNALHGGAGENGEMQDFLGSWGRRYTGSGVQASALCMDKARTRQELRRAGLTTAPGRLVRRAEWGSQDRRVLVELSALPHEGGWFVKPNTGGSSVGVRMVEDPAELRAAIEAVLAAGDEALVEARVDGVEETVGVLGLPATGLVSLPVVEIVPDEGRWFDYEQKYDSSQGATERTPPERVTPELCGHLGNIARRAFEVTGCEGYARVDFVVPSGLTIGGEAVAGQLQEPVILELNTLPGLTARSLLPQAAAAAGADLRCLALEICALALIGRRSG